MTTPESQPRPLLSVLTTGQQPSRTQRKGRYTPESIKHPGKMLPAIASQIIQAYTVPGELVVDPMCGIGTTLVEAMHLGRRAAGMEHESDFVQMSLDNMLHARQQDAGGRAQIVQGDARNISTVYKKLRGMAALILTSPPYGSHTHGHLRSTKTTGKPGITKTNYRYTQTRDNGNLANANLPELIEGFGQILYGCRDLLIVGGRIAVTVRPIRVKGELIDLPGLVTEVAESRGLVLTGRHAALLCAIRDGQLVTRASFFQMVEAKRAISKGIPACAVAHEDLLIFQTDGDQLGGTR